MKFFDLTTFLLTFLSHEICPENIAVSVFFGTVSSKHILYIYVNFHKPASVTYGFHLEKIFSLFL